MSQAHIRNSMTLAISIKKIIMLISVKMAADCKTNSMERQIV